LISVTGKLDWDKLPDDDVRWFDEEDELGFVTPRRSCVGGGVSFARGLGFSSGLVWWMTLSALGEQGDAVRSLDHMREIVARDSGKLGVLEQLLVDTHVLFIRARTKDESFAGLMRDLCFGLRMTLSALGEQGDAVRSLDHMREIVARDSGKLGVLEQLLVDTHVRIRLKDGYWMT
nr:hypothetical protein [Tanacetum cinerariifolium]